MAKGKKVAALHERLRGKGYKAGKAPPRPAADAKAPPRNDSKPGLINRS